MKQPIFHLANTADAEKLASTGEYHTASLDTEGFIHCCTTEQLAGVMQRYYSDADTLVLWAIDDTKLQANIVYENTMGGKELFPHVYGTINQSAIFASEVMDRARINQIVSSGEFEGMQA